MGGNNKRSNNNHGGGGEMVEHSGIEPLTFWLPAKRSPS